MQPHQPPSLKPDLANQAKPAPLTFARLGALGLALSLLGLGSGCQAPRQPVASAASMAQPRLAAVELPSDTAATEDMLRFLALRLKRDPDDFSARNRQAGLLLKRLRETSDVTYLSLALRASHASLASVPATVNRGGLVTLAQAEFAGHEFVQSRAHALRLAKMEPDKSEYQGMLGDAQLELGAYDEAARSYQKMQAAGGGSGVETRLARLVLLHGGTAGARQHFFRALAFALNTPQPSRETVAWCRWQLGETAFSIGDYPTAEQHYRDALTTFPGYFRALASLGRVRAARGDLKDAITQYEQAVAVIPDPSFVAALGDLHQLSGNRVAAAAQYNLVEKIGHLSAANGILYNRQLALFYADHDLHPAAAYAAATKEYAVRRDIYGADAVAWTALKAGHVAAAQKAIKAALRLGTQDARLFYHAALIAKAAGDKAAAHRWLQRALQLNPQFDPLQSTLARKALATWQS